MRAFLLVFAIGCGPDVDGNHAPRDGNIAPPDVMRAIDAAPSFDADIGFCDAAPTSANITVVSAGVTTMYHRVQIAATPVSTDTTQAVALRLVFDDTARMEATAVEACIHGDVNCPTEGIVVYSSLEHTAPGVHLAGFGSTTNSGFGGEGTVTITSFAMPDMNGLGHVVGSITTVPSLDSADGTFENDICFEENLL